MRDVERIAEMIWSLQECAAAPAAELKRWELQGEVSDVAARLRVMLIWRYGVEQTRALLD